MSVIKVLSPEAQELREDFEGYELERGTTCTCWNHPPCSWCTHPGNPMNQEDDYEYIEPLNESVLNKLLFD